MLRDLSSSLKTRLRTLRGDVIVRLDLNSLADSLDSELIEHDDSAGQAIFAESDRISNELPTRHCEGSSPRLRSC